jgi:hypothetical protein
VWSPAELFSSTAVLLSHKAIRSPHLNHCFSTCSLTFWKGWLLCLPLNTHERVWDAGLIINETSNNQLLTHSLTIFR